MTLRSVGLASIEPAVGQDALRFLAEEVKAPEHTFPAPATLALLLDDTGLPLGWFGIEDSTDGSPGKGVLIGTPGLFRQGYSITHEARC